jgi:GAF domain-containing protein
MKCPRCQQDNPTAQKFCGECGTPLKAVSHIDPAAPSYAEVTRALSEALDQQAAMSEILRVISQSPTDAAPVFEVIVKNACRLCDAVIANAIRFDGQLMHNMAQQGFTPEAEEVMRRLFPMKPTRSSMAGRAILSGAVVHTEDVGSDHELLASREFARVLGFRAQVSVPMLRDGVPVGAITVARRSSGLFPERQISMLRGFADQAVIAVENVRLFNETKEALEQQTATAEILRVISSSPTNIQPVLDAVAESAKRLCEGYDAWIGLREGEHLRVRAHHGPIPIALDLRPLNRGRVSERAVVDRQPVHVHDLAASGEEFPLGHADAVRIGHRTTLGVPLLREGEAIGVILIRRLEVRPFTDRQIALLQTFADQAVIAIENVRLFTELQEKNQALTQAHAQVSEALDQQTATSEILRVISRSPTDAQPVFETIARNAMGLLGGASSGVVVVAGDDIDLGALAIAAGGEAYEVARRFYPMSRAEFARLRPPLSRVLETQAAVRIEDLRRVESEAIREYAGTAEIRSAVAVPMLRDREAIGLIVVNRREPYLFTDDEVALLETFAAQAVIAIENVRLFRELEARNADLTDALARETATSEILRVISRSPTDVQPVFNAIVESAMRLCGARVGHLFRFDGELLYLVAGTSTPAYDDLVQRLYPMRPSQGQVSGRAILSRTVAQIPDVLTDPDYRHDLAVAGDWRSRLGVPLLREGSPIGVIVIMRADPGLFADYHIELLKTFADQAVIAIENVRLFTELQEKNRELTQAHAQVSEALERQTATSEILRVISSSPTDAQPVFEVIVRRAVRLCGGVHGGVLKLSGDVLSVVALENLSAVSTDLLLRLYPRSPDRSGLVGLAIRQREVVHSADVERDPRTADPELARRAGYSSVLAVPILRSGEPIGAIFVTSTRPFGAVQMELLQTFADQAVIAIENVRLFTELQDKNRALTEAHAQVTEALEQQTATAEILRVISQSQTNVQPVFDTIVRNAVRLCGASHGGVYRFDGELVHFVAHEGYTPEQLEHWRRQWPRPVTAASITCQAIRTRSLVRIADVELHELTSDDLANVRARGARSVMAVPMFRQREIIGAISLAHRDVDAFSDAHVGLIKTFADLAVIAIENARLLTELQARTYELTRSVGELTALGDVGRALSSTLDLETVLQTIVTRANTLAGTAGCTIWEYDDAHEQFRLRVSHYADARDAAILGAPDRVTTIRRGQGVTTQVVERRQPVQIADIAAEGAYESPIRRALLEAGHRGLLGVPLLREEQVIGVLAVTRKTPGEFEADVVRLLSTFATQSALAIQNARLFREIEGKSRQLELASQHKSEFLANMSHELRTPLNAIIGFSEVLGERMFGELNAKQEEYLKDIHASGQHLLSLINDILDLSKIEAGRMELELAEFHFPQAIENALVLVRERALRRGITLEQSIAPRLGEIRGDERKIKQVLLNLLSNAIKFTPEDGRVEVRAIPVDGSVEVSVTDTGVGIAPEDQEAIFEEFRQVGTADKKVEGTGLGLALSRKFIELHGGRIWVESQIGVGSTFTFTIPIRTGA